MKLITEVNDKVVLKEAVDETGKQNFFIEGIFMQSNIQNRNGRVYPSDVLDKQVQSYIDNYVNKNRALGELGHPDGPAINLDRVSHKIVELRKEGDNWIGRAKILSTPNGEIVKGLLKDGVEIGVSSRALGSLRKHQEGYDVVQDDLHLVTAADIVADPSAPDAYVQGIMEGKEWILEGGIFKQIDPSSQLKQARKQVDRVIRDTKQDKMLREQALLHLFYQHLSKLSK